MSRRTNNFPASLVSTSCEGYTSMWLPYRPYSINLKFLADNLQKESQFSKRRDSGKLLAILEASSSNQIGLVGCQLRLSTDVSKRESVVPGENTYRVLCGSGPEATSQANC